MTFTWVWWPHFHLDLLVLLSLISKKSCLSSSCSDTLTVQSVSLLLRLQPWKVLVSAEGRLTSEPSQIWGGISSNVHNHQQRLLIQSSKFHLFMHHIQCSEHLYHLHVALTFQTLKHLYIWDLMNLHWNSWGQTSFNPSFLMHWKLKIVKNHVYRFKLKYL